MILYIYINTFSEVYLCLYNILNQRECQEKLYNEKIYLYKIGER